MSTAPRFLSRIVTLAALIGLVPFVVALAITIFPDISPLPEIIFERATIGYGALILSFLGGVRWGIRLQGGAGSDLTFVTGIAGSVIGFITLLLPYSLGLAILVVGFAGQGAWDVWAGHIGWVPQLYARLRSLMTWLVCIVLLAILLARTLVSG